MKKSKFEFSKLKLDKITILPLDNGGNNILGGVSGALSCVNTDPVPPKPSNGQDPCTIAGPTSFLNCPTIARSCTC